MPRWDFHRAEEKAAKELARVQLATSELAALYVETIEGKGAQALPNTLHSCRLVLRSLETVDQRAAAAITRERVELLEANEAGLREKRERGSA